ncbi:MULTISPECIES: helix-turn-helix domain-containing protein [Cupriavidus]|uniref:helix-turn-helix domain-containing protein n=1 Tax=Cupriavidus TaxID=106589 RepID=UPI0002A242F6|nr:MULTISPECIES: helix-turn-helix transcriptional regulator [Cupriavidus]EKZ99953.1 hypothetical protein D769_07433 [Cupriavidus sp. HMR-1]QWC89303.1 helix-turn-helix transcriptional regulator [Cupriavidus metallidurans]
MSYKELIALAMKGKSVYQRSKELGVNQMTLGRYARGERLPDYQTAFLLANEAGIELGEAFRVLAEEEAKRKGIEMDPLRQTKSC